MTKTMSDRLQERLNQAPTEAEKAYLLGLLITTRDAETAVTKAATNPPKGKTR